MSVTSTGADFSACAAQRPPNPPPTMTTRPRSPIAFTRLRCCIFAPIFSRASSPLSYLFEDFVSILQRAQINVALQVVAFAPVGLVRAHHLFSKALDLRRQQPVQAKRAPFVLRE